MGENDADSSCVENPESTTQITCPSEMTYCMVLRIEYQVRNKIYIYVHIDLI